MIHLVMDDFTSNDRNGDQNFSEADISIPVRATLALA